MRRKNVLMTGACWLVGWVTHSQGWRLPLTLPTPIYLRGKLKASACIRGRREKLRGGRGLQRNKYPVPPFEREIRTEFVFYVDSSAGAVWGRHVVGEMKFVGNNVSPWGFGVNIK